MTKFANQIDLLDSDGSVVSKKIDDARIHIKNSLMFVLDQLNLLKDIHERLLRIEDQKIKLKSIAKSDISKSDIRVKNEVKNYLTKLKEGQKELKELEREWAKPKKVENLLNLKKGIDLSNITQDMEASKVTELDPKFAGVDVQAHDELRVDMITMLLEEISTFIEKHK